MINRNLFLIIKKGSLGLFFFFIFFYPVFFLFKESFLLIQQEGINLFKNILIKEAFFFSFKQALLSSFISVFLAILNVYFLRKTSPPLRKLLFIFLFIPSGISAIVGILSFLALGGKQGLIGYYFPIISQNFYSWKTLIFFNVIYNFSFLSLIFYSSSLYFPYPLLKKAKKLGASSFQRFFSIIVPLMKSHIFLGFSLSFIFCFMSFYPLLFLGAKEGFLSPEVLIYQKINREFNLKEACFIAWLEWLFILCFILFFIYQRPLYEPFHEKKRENYNIFSSILASLISSLSFFLWLPLIFKVFKNFPLSIMVLYNSLSAFLNSLLVGIISSCLILLLSILLIEFFRKELKNKKILLLLFSPLGLSPLITSYLYSEFLINWFDFSSPLLSLILSQSILGLPLILYLLIHELAEFQALPMRAKKMGANSLEVFASITYPLFKKSYVKAFFLNFFFSFGNLSTGFLYLPKNFETVPLKIYRYLQSYKIEEAFILSGLFILFFFLVFFIYKEIKKHL